MPNTRIDNPQYVAIPKQQNKLKDDSKIVEDSLLALSKRAPQISAIVNREINAIHLNMDKTVKATCRAKHWRKHHAHAVHNDFRK